MGNNELVGNLMFAAQASLVMIIITTLSQEDNIFGTGASLTCCHQLQLRIVLFVIMVLFRQPQLQL